MVNFFSSHLQKEKFSNSEQYLLSYLEEHQTEISQLSIVKLSEKANVSTATIIRTMKKLGFDGFTSFKYALKSTDDVAEGYEIINHVDEEIKQAIIKNEQEVNRTIQLLERGTIEDTIQKIKAAKKVYIFARGFSELIAKEMMIKFQLMRKNCEMHDDPNIIRTISKSIQIDEIVIFISLNGETEELVEAAKNCIQHHVSIVTITANKESMLASISEITFVGYKSTISYFPDYEVRSRLPLEVISRILLDAYAIRTKK